MTPNELRRLTVKTMAAAAFSVLTITQAATGATSSERTYVLQLGDGVEIPQLKLSCSYRWRDGGRSFVCVRSDARNTIVTIGPQRVGITDGRAPVFSVRG